MFKDIVWTNFHTAMASTYFSLKYRHKTWRPRCISSLFVHSVNASAVTIHPNELVCILLMRRQPQRTWVFPSFTNKPWLTKIYKAISGTELDLSSPDRKFHAVPKRKKNYKYSTRSKSAFQCSVLDLKKGTERDRHPHRTLPHAGTALFLVLSQRALTKP